MKAGDNDEQISHKHSKSNLSVTSLIRKPVEDSKIIEYNKFSEYMLCTRGLKNLGNTCFFNSTLQCLNATRDLVHTYTTLQNKSEYLSSSNSMNSLLKNFFVDIRRVSSTYNPQPLFAGVCARNSRFKGFQQQDAHDLLINILEMLQQENDKINKRSKDEKLRGVKRSLIEDVFGSYYLNTVLCLDCMRVSRTRDPTLDVSVTISFKNQKQPMQASTLSGMLAKKQVQAL